MGFGSNSDVWRDWLWVLVAPVHGGPHRAGEARARENKGV